MASLPASEGLPALQPGAHVDVCVCSESRTRPRCGCLPLRCGAASQRAVLQVATMQATGVFSGWGCDSQSESLTIYDSLICTSIPEFAPTCSSFRPTTAYGAFGSMSFVESVIDRPLYSPSPVLFHFPFYAVNPGSLNMLGKILVLAVVPSQNLSILNFSGKTRAKESQPGCQGRLNKSLKG